MLSASSNNFIDDLDDIRSVYNQVILITWGVLLLFSYPLLAYTSTNIVYFQRYSPTYAGGLILYFSTLTLSLIFFFLPRRTILWFAGRMAYLRANIFAMGGFMAFYTSIGALVLVLMRLWGWGYNPLLRINIILLSAWIGLIPVFWDWRYNGWYLSVITIDDIYNWVTRNTRIWLPPAIVVGVLTLSAALAYQGSSRLFMAVPGLLAVIAGMIILFKWPLLGLLALIGSTVISVDGPSGFNATPAMIIVLLGLWIVDMLVRQRQAKFLPSSTFPPLFILVVVASLAFGFGQLQWFTFGSPASLGAQIGGLSLYFLSAAAFLAVAHTIKQIRWLQWMTWLFLIQGSFFVIMKVIPGMQAQAAKFIHFATIGSLFWVWMAALSFSQAVFNDKLPWVWRAPLGVLAALTLFVGVFIGREWNSGWVPTLAAAGTIVLIAKPKLGLIGIAMAGLGAIIKLQDLIAAVMVGDNEYSLGTRIDAWLIIWEMTQVNPILGLGPANYNAYTVLFPIRGWSVTFNSHSQYIDLIAQTGLLGLICFLWFFGTVGLLIWRLTKRMPSGFAQAYIYGAMGGLVGTLVSAGFGDWVIPFFFNVGFRGFRASVLSWVFLGAVVALAQIYPDTTDQKGS